MAFDNVQEPVGKAEASCYFDPSQRMLNAMRLRPADVVKKAALPYQFEININLHAPGYRKCHPRDHNTVSNDIRRTACSNKYFYISLSHCEMNNTTLKKNFNKFGANERFLPAPFQ